MNLAICQVNIKKMDVLFLADALNARIAEFWGKDECCSTFTMTTLCILLFHQVAHVPIFNSNLNETENL